MQLADWLPQWVPERVFFCKQCATVWHARQDRYMGRHVAEQVPPTIVPLLQEGVTVEGVVDCIAACPTPARHLVEALGGIFVRGTDESLRLVVDTIVGALERDGLSGDSASILVYLLNQAVARAASANGVPAPLTGAPEDEPYAHLRQRPSGAPAAAPEAILSLETLKPALRLPFEQRLYKGVDPARRLHVLREVVDNLDGILVHLRQSENRGVLAMPDKDWDELAQVVSVGGGLT